MKKLGIIDRLSFIDLMLNIRNFAIIAHVDHGKSTLADRFLEITGTVEKGKHNEQLLDRNPISRERGITIKLAPVRMKYKNPKFQILNPKQYQNPNFQNSKPIRILDLEFRVSNSEYILNLIDTPGHIDFSYEVDRTLACVEGVILLVDATTGIQAQTIVNAYKALEKNLVIIPAVNKIDLPNAQVENTKKQLVDFLGVNEEEVYLVSARTGQGVENLLQAIIEKVPLPDKNSGFEIFYHTRVSPSKSEGPLESEKNLKPSFNHLSPISYLQSLIFDSYYDPHRGVIAFVRVFSGEIKKGQRVFLANVKVEIMVEEVGYFTPDLEPAEKLVSGEIGYVVTNLKDIHQVRVGETVVDTVENGGDQSLPGYKKIKPMVFAGIFPTDTADYLNLKKALEKLYLNDSSLEFSPIQSKALGSGFRVGFLGLLHAEVVQERLEREFGLSLVLTPPQVEFREEKGVFLEPYVKVTIITPRRFLGDVLQLLQSYRAEFAHMDSIILEERETTIQIVYRMPMSELISDFFNRLKSVSSGYASLDWEFLEYRPVKAGKLMLLINGEPVEEFSEIVVEERSYQKGQFLVSRLKELIPRQQYEVRIQAAYKGRIIASSRIAPFRKDVLVKSGKVLGTGDVGRKRKLLERQKEGKKRMKMVGRVEIPKEAFMKLFKR